MGDLGNITVDDEGKAQIQIIDRYATLFGERCIIGRCVALAAAIDTEEFPSAAVVVVHCYYK